MNKFDLLFNNLMESMVAGGPMSVLGSPAGGEVGSTGGSVGNIDSWNTGSTALAHSLYGTYQKRNKPETIGRKKKKKK
jgi:hypothetical protein